jgi:hypothetical protein
VGFANPHCNIFVDSLSLETLKNPGWELRMSVAFGSLLAIIVVGVFFFAERAI